MTPENSYRQEMSAAQDAADLLAQPGLEAVFGRLEALYMAEWRTSRLDQAVEREQAFAKLAALDALRQDLHNTVSNGQHAIKAIEAMASRAMRDAV